MKLLVEKSVAARTINFQVQYIKHLEGHIELLQERNLKLQGKINQQTTDLGRWYPCNPPVIQ